jgi:small subunit ribosomal protein S16
MLKIRLKRVGRRHEPVYRLVATESTTGPKSGKQVEILGSYDPRFDKVQFNAERIKYWLGVGAKASPTAHNILVGQKIIEGNKINVLPRKSPIVKEGADAVGGSPQTSAGTASATSAEAPKESGEKKEDKSEVTDAARAAAELTKDAAAAA